MKQKSKPTLLIALTLIIVGIVAAMNYSSIRSQNPKLFTPPPPAAPSTVLGHSQATITKKQLTAGIAASIGVSPGDMSHVPAKERALMQQPIIAAPPKMTAYVPKPTSTQTPSNWWHKNSYKDTNQH